MGKIDDDYKREITLRAIADSAWNFVSSLPFELYVILDQNVITREEIVDAWKEELEKLV